MSVDLGDLVTSLKLEISPPGTDLFPDATESEWIDRLSAGFWNARLDGILKGYSEVEGEIIPDDPNADDMPRDLQQVIVFMAAYNTIYLRMLGEGGRTKFRAKAGAVEYETEQSANVLRELAASLKDRYRILLERLSDLGMVPTYVIDSVIAKETSLIHGDTWWVGAEDRGFYPSRGF